MVVKQKEKKNEKGSKLAFNPFVLRCCPSSNQKKKKGEEEEKKKEEQ